MKYTLPFILLLVAVASNAQFLGKQSITIESLYSTGNDMPFWFSHNQSGKYNIPSKTNQLLSLQSINKVDNLFKTPLDLRFGADFIATYSNQYNVHFNQLFIGASIWNFKLEAGRFTDEVNFSGLSSTNGNIDRSLNARPYPKIRFATDGFIPFFFWKEWFSYKGEYDEGWLGEERYVKNARLHHKSLFVNFKLNARTKYIFGLNHYVMWGGTSPNEGKLPDSFKDYLLYITGSSGDSTFLETDQINTAGNQLGSYYMQLELLRNQYNLTFYFSHPFEDHSGMEMDNWRDNLLGVFFDFKRKAFIEKALYEFMYAVHQSGDNHQGGYRGRDSYYNHGVYASGFTYMGYSMASPLFSPIIMNNNISKGFENNRLIMHHIGLEGSLFENLNWKGLFTYSHNLGTYSYPYPTPKNQFSSILSFDYTQPKLPVDISLSLAADLGTLYDDRFGAMLKLSKNW